MYRELCEMCHCVLYLLCKINVGVSCFMHLVSHIAKSMFIIYITQIYSGITSGRVLDGD